MRKFLLLLSSRTRRGIYRSLSAFQPLLPEPPYFWLSAKFSCAPLRPIAVYEAREFRKNPKRRNAVSTAGRKLYQIVREGEAEVAAGEPFHRARVDARRAQEREMAVEVFALGAEIVADAGEPLDIGLVSLAGVEAVIAGIGVEGEIADQRHGREVQQKALEDAAESGARDHRGLMERDRLLRR